MKITMRKWLCIGMVLLCRLTAAGDDVLTATLQHGNQMTPFFGKDAFRDANAAAEDGDVITLSGGWFGAFRDTISKSIRIVGQFGLGLSTPAYPQTASYTSNATYITADNVFIEGINPSNQGLTIVGDNCMVKRCWTSVRVFGKNALIDQCSSWSVDLFTGKNCVIRNSTVQQFRGMNTVDNMVTVTNSVICYFYKNGDPNYKQPYGIYRNCILGLDVNTENSPDHMIVDIPEYIFQAPSEFHYNYLYRINSVYPESEQNAIYYVPYSFAPGCVNDHNVVSSENSSAIHGSYYCTTTSFSFQRQETWGPMTGSDGTHVGIRGGTGYSVYPGIPRFASAEIEQQTDIDGVLKASFYLRAEKENPEDNPSVVLFEYWVDDPYGNKREININPPGNNSTFNPSFDFSELSVGSHTLYYRIKDSYGAYSPLYVQTFERTNPYDNELYLPYDATGPKGDQQTANPTYSAYPTEIESKMPPLQCN